MYLYPIPSACGEKPLTSTEVRKETMFAFICTFSSWWFDVLWDLSFPITFSELLTGSVGEETKCSCVGFSSWGAEGLGILPTAPLLGSPLSNTEGSNGGGRRMGWIGEFGEFFMVLHRLRKLTSFSLNFPHISATNTVWMNCTHDLIISQPKKKKGKRRSKVPVGFYVL